MKFRMKVSLATGRISGTGQKRPGLVQGRSAKLAAKDGENRLTVQNRLTVPSVPQKWDKCFAIWRAGWSCSIMSQRRAENATDQSASNLLSQKTKNAASPKGDGVLFDRDSKEEMPCPWQVWQRPTLPGLKP
jgi:hypothetical protein